MKKNLITSKLDRENILNNPFAMKAMEQQLGIKTHYFDHQYYLTAREIANFYDIDIRTLRRYLSLYGQELKDNGYKIIKDDDLKRFINLYLGDNIVTDISSKSPQLSLFSFRAFINLGMLLANNEVAKTLRSVLLDLVIEVINQRAGGDVKYLNQRDENYLVSLYLGEKYHFRFRQALKEHVDMGNFKYAIYGRKIYQTIFKEHVDEYRQLLKLEGQEKIKPTLYAEVLTTISAFENGLADEIVAIAKQLNRKLTSAEVNSAFAILADNPLLEPQLELVKRENCRNLRLLSFRT